MQGWILEVWELTVLHENLRVDGKDPGEEGKMCLREELIRDGWRGCLAVGWDPGRGCKAVCGAFRQQRPTQGGRAGWGAIKI